MARNISLNEYLNRLAAKTPAPGGGSAAALVGALGAALLAMAAKYTLNKAKTATARSRVLSAAEFSEIALHRLMALMHEDEEAYNRLAREIKKRHPGNMLRLYKAAIDVPMEVCEIASKSATKCLEVCDYCKTSIISDIVEAAVLCEAAFLSAKLNIQVNLCSIEDAAYINRICKKLRNSENKIRKAKELAVRKAQKFLR